MSKAERDDSPVIGGVPVPPGKRTEIELRVTRLPTGTWASIPVFAIRGKLPGPWVWVSAAIHGDELNGVEIVRRLLRELSPKQLRGTVLAVPIANILGFLHQDRYLPDRRDLNRSFPGSARGSLAGRMAHLFMSEVVHRCQYGIDLHTGSHHRKNFPQLRTNLEDPTSLRLAKAFRAPLAIHASGRDGSLRQVAAEQGCPVLVYEAGEALRLDHEAIQLGLQGVLRVLGELEMISEVPEATGVETRRIQSTRWIRAPRGGILLMDVRPGDVVEEGQVLARITEAFSSHEAKICAPCAGVAVGLTTHPLVNRGDALVNLGVIDDAD